MTPLSSDRLALLRAVLAEKGLGTLKSTGIPRRANPDEAPLSSAQERLFFLELYQPGTALYNDSVAVRIEGELDPARLRRALAEVQRRHEILRTSFALTGDGPVQRIHGAGEPPLCVVDLASAADATDAATAADDDTMTRARALASAEARSPFELERAPLWRGTLARLAECDWLFVLTMHHIVSDGASMGLFFDELAALYASHSTGEEPDLAPLPVQFGDYAAWERGSGGAEDERRAAQQLAYWKGVLGGQLENLVWPESRGRASQRGASVPLHFQAELAARLARFSRGEHVTSNQILLAAYLAFLSVTTGATDLRTGIASSLRQRRELDPLLGFFVQSLVLRMDLGGDPSFLELLRRVRVAALEALQHGDLPYDRVARALERRGGPPLMQTYFSHMKDAIRAPVFAGARTSWEFVDAGVARFELALVLHESAAEIRGFLEYDQGLFTERTASQLANDYASLVAAVVERPELRLSELRSRCAPRGRVPRRRTPPPFPTRAPRATQE